MDAGVRANQETEPRKFESGVLRKIAVSKSKLYRNDGVQDKLVGFMFHMHSQSESKTVILNNLL